MPRVRPKRIVYIAVAFALAGTVTAALFALSDTCASAPTSLARLEWLVPLVAGVLIGGITLILVGGRTGETSEEGPSPATSECAACGSPILESWRLCPDCGSLLECDTRQPVSGRADLRST